MNPRSLLRNVGLLELALIGAMLALIAQLVPETTGRLFSGLVWSLDVRNWPWAVRVLANFLVVAVFVLLRFLTEIRESFAERSKRLQKTKRNRGKAPDFEGDQEQEDRYKRDAEWAQRAKKRLPYT